MTYPRRIFVSGCCAVLLHLSAAAIWVFAPRGPVLARELPLMPLVLNLQPPEAPRRQLVDVAESTDEAVTETDLIAEVNAKAADDTPGAGEDLGPVLEELSDFDALAQAPAPETPAPEAAASAPPAGEQPLEQAEEQAAEQPRAQTAVLDAPRLPQPLESAAVLPEKEPAPEQAQAAEAGPAENLGPFQVAKASPAPPRPVAPPAPDVPPAPIASELAQPERSRAHDGVGRRGPTNFEAIKDEIAPYLKEIRKKVRRKWIEMLVGRYSGTSPAEVVFDIAISPVGELVSVRVVGVAKERVYAALCKEALRDAAPFGPFTFQVPEFYRGKNLEIRWTFDFL